MCPVAYFIGFLHTEEGLYISVFLTLRRCIEDWMVDIIFFWKSGVTLSGGNIVTRKIRIYYSFFSVSGIGILGKKKEEEEEENPSFPNLSRTQPRIH